MNRKTLAGIILIVFALANCATVDRMAVRVGPDGTRHELKERIRASWGSGLQDAEQSFSAAYKDGEWNVQSSMNGTGLTSPDITSQVIRGMTEIGGIVSHAYETALPIRAETEKLKIESDANLKSEILEKVPNIPLGTR